MPLLGRSVVHPVLSEKSRIECKVKSTEYTEGEVYSYSIKYESPMKYWIYQALVVHGLATPKRKISALAYTLNGTRYSYGGGIHSCTSYL